MENPTADTENDQEQESGDESELSDDELENLADPNDWEPPLPDPRRIGCPFYLYAEKKMRAAMREQSGTVCCVGHERRVHLDSHTNPPSQEVEVVQRKEASRRDSESHSQIEVREEVQEREETVHRGVHEMEETIVRVVDVVESSHGACCSYGISVIDNRNSHGRFYSFLADLPPPVLNDKEYYILFMWQQYVDNNPEKTRKEMRKELLDEWFRQSPDFQVLFKTFAREHRLWYVQEMKRMDPEWDERVMKIAKIRELETQTYRPPCFYYMYMKCPAMMARFPGG